MLLKCYKMLLLYNKNLYGNCMKMADSFLVKCFKHYKVLVVRIVVVFFVFFLAILVFHFLKSLPLKINPDFT